MLQTIIKQNSYQDSVVLMLLTSKLNQLPFVERVSIMMGTPANKDIFIASGFDTPELADATANDMVIMLEVNDESKTDDVLTMIDEELNKDADNGGEVNENINSWEKALKKMPDANVALLSIPGTYAALEAEKALDNGLHAFIFSDNMSLEDETRLKQKAHEKGLLVMGPDCGTGILHRLPLAFTNNTRPGGIGVVGASGTGIQEVTTLVHRYGAGITNAIGTGGRDLSSEVGATTMMDGILALNHDDNTEVIVIISKPPAQEIKEKVLARLHAVEKPVVALFLGDKPTEHEENLYHAYTLEEAAQLSVKLLNKEEILYVPSQAKAVDVKLAPSQTGIKGYYAGGTLAYEASVLIEEALELEHHQSPEGYTLKHDSHEVIDLGDDMYTSGKPHPMIDPENRINKIKDVINQEETAVVLFDVVLGYGAHMDMASELVKPITEVQTALKETDREVAFVAVIVGTDLDPQGYDEQRQILEEAGVVVCENNVEAIQTALSVIDRGLTFAEKAVKPAEKSNETLPDASDAIQRLMNEKPKVINIGLKSFTDSILDNHGEVVHFEWKPAAGGDVHLQKVLYFLDHYEFDKEAH
ncbi:acyl-CoA synthetase FdrA [Vagococcus lutrae]|uniref:Acyl-CoA synthetase FdrA n=1 Tax=Vagococcus lutrae TaxID=81947 RepID=A0AAE9XEU8_9ENTE|nr:acyl-CoA synthetase FdrA [Vagococcus lutrae]RST92273.1 acyl-CoA synthetase FdrA [Vagococcus lutrae]WCG23004.1 acyl-CoA synthetase FdrA [Vagococcus lutrae]